VLARRCCCRGAVVLKLGMLCYTAPPVSGCRWRSILCLVVRPAFGRMS
jgi:hypothetical protein